MDESQEFIDACRAVDLADIALRVARMNIEDGRYISNYDWSPEAGFELVATESRFRLAVHNLWRIRHDA